MRLYLKKYPFIYFFKKLRMLKSRGSANLAQLILAMWQNVCMLYEKILWTTKLKKPFFWLLIKNIVQGYKLRVLRGTLYNQQKMKVALSCENFAICFMSFFNMWVCIDVCILFECLWLCFCLCWLL